LKEGCSHVVFIIDKFAMEMEMVLVRRMFEDFMLDKLYELLSEKASGVWFMAPSL
jgi:hypothetical protein